MRSRAIAVCVVAMMQASGARAGECVVNGNEVPPSSLASELEVGFGGIPGQLAGVPFSVVNYDQMSISWNGCADDCLYISNQGDSQCGNLVAAPVESMRTPTVTAVPDPYAFSHVFAGQAENGKWNVLASAFVDPYWEQESKSAVYDFEVGTREVIDVAGSAGTKPLDIYLRGGSRVEGIEVGCFGDVFRWIPNHQISFRVTELTTFTTLVNTTYWTQFFSRTQAFTIDVQPGWVLQVDVLLDVFANATGAQDLGGQYCDGAYAYIDLAGPPDSDGVQLFLDPDPSMTLTPRSGIVYEAPEPGAGAAASIAIALLAARKRLT